MHSRERTLVPAADLPAPTPLPSLPMAFSRRAALFGAVTARPASWQPPERLHWSKGRS